MGAPRDLEKKQSSRASGSSDGVSSPNLIGLPYLAGCLRDDLSPWVRADGEDEGGIDLCVCVCVSSETCSPHNRGVWYHKPQNLGRGVEEWDIFSLLGDVPITSVLCVSV